MAELANLIGEPLGDPLVRRAAAEVILIGIAGGTLGCWIVHFGLPYAAESLAHCMLPGLVLAALAGLPLAVGGAVGLAAGAGAIGVASRAPGLDRDTAIAVAVTTLLGLGALLALSAEVPANLASILFGDVLATDRGDLLLAGVLVAVVGLALFVLHPRLLAVGFDGARSYDVGIRPGTVEACLFALVAVAVLIAVQGLGNLLAVASLVGPAAAARLLSRRMVPMMATAAAIAVGSGLTGLFASYHLDLAAGASVAGATVLLCGSLVGARSLRRRLAARSLREGLEPA